MKKAIIYYMDDRAADIVAYDDYDYNRYGTILVFTRPGDREVIVPLFHVRKVELDA